MMIPRFLLFLLLIIGLAFAADTAQNEDGCSESDKDDLQVQQDRPALYKPGYQLYLWSSIITLEKEPDEGELVAIAHKASQEMQVTIGGAPKKKHPTVMTALQVGKEVYLASSATGDYSPIYEDRQNSREKYPGSGNLRSSVPAEIKEALEESKESNNKDTSRQNIQHKNDASCGEAMASYTYLVNNNMKGLKGKTNPKPKSIAWRHTAKNDEAYDPCGKGDKDAWGCDALCDKMGFTVVDVETKEATSYPKVAHTTQKTIMTKELKEDVNAMIDESKKNQQNKAGGRQGNGKFKRWEA